MLNGLQQRAAQQKLRPEQLGFGGPLLARFCQPQVQHLAGVVPLVHRMMHIQAFVALQPDQVGLQQRSQHLGHFGFANAGFAFQQQRAVQAQRQKDGSGQAAIGNVHARAQRFLQRVYRAYFHRASSITQTDSSSII